MIGKTRGIDWPVNLCVAMLVAGWFGLLQAQVPDKLNYQGFLTGPGGTAVTGAQTMVFKLYNVVSGGAALYSETQTVQVNNGVFNAVLGSVTSLNLPFDVPYFIGITVGADAEMTPRQPLASAPYAQRADTANALAAAATLPASQLSGTIGTAQIANNAVTQAKLSPSGAASGKVLGTDGTNLQWQSAGSGTGTVTSVGTGTGLSGGPITATGTINLAVTQLLPASACAINQIPKWSGSAWACALDNDAGGTVTSITAATGLAGGTITSAGTMALATGYRLPQSCTSAQLVQSDGAGNWVCVTSLSGGDGNVQLVNSTPTTGNIIKGGNRFLHNFGTGNTFLGANAGNFTMSGSNNTGAGLGALFSSTSGSNNTASGVFALLNNTTGMQNTAHGVNALFSNSVGFSNTAVGVNALSLNTNGTQNTASGVDALFSNATGSNNTAVGMNALFANAAGSNNTAMGSGALQNHIGDDTTAVGYQALSSNTTGNSNSAVGVSALAHNTGGNGNTATGRSALFTNTGGSNNTAVGSGALQSHTGDDTIAFGYQALASNTTGQSNSAMGFEALASNTAGHANTATGYIALNHNANGIGNTASGWKSMEQNLHGNGNTAVGEVTLQSSTDGDENTAIGESAMWAAAGSLNTAVGSNALAAGQGEENTAVGYKALLSVQGTNNVAIGSRTAGALTQGNNNIAIGVLAGENLTSGSGNIYVGSEGAATESDTIRIGSGNVIGHQNRFFVAGVFGIVSANSSRSAVYVDNAGQLGVLPSSRRYKDDISDMDSATADLMRLRPVTFHYKLDQDRSAQSLQYGLVAEEVAEVYPGLVTHTPDGQVESVMYHFLPSMLLNEFQKQQRTIRAQAEAMSRQAAAMNQQMEAMSQQAKRIAELEQDRRVQLARIEALESQAAEIALLKQQMTQIVRRQGEDGSVVPRVAATAGDVSVTRSR
jgi:hypothetical protein